jgi:hypothetical protein
VTVKPRVAELRLPDHLWQASPLGPTCHTHLYSSAWCFLVLLTGGPLAAGATLDINRHKWACNQLLTDADQLRAVREKSGS